MIKLENLQALGALPQIALPPAIEGLAPDPILRTFRALLIKGPRKNLLPFDSFLFLSPSH